VRVDVHVHNLGVGHVQHGAAALGLDADVHRDRGPPEADQAGREADDVADQHGLLELDAVDRHRDQVRDRPAGQDDLAAAADRPRLVDVAQQDAAENGHVHGVVRVARYGSEVWVRVARHHDDLERDVRLAGGGHTEVVRKPAAPS
jgi:hypothetical protein